MKRIRINNDITLRWTILTNGEAVSLEGRDLRVELKSAYAKKQVDFSVEGNVITFFFLGGDQRTLGVYSAILQETTDGIMRTIDECNAFELVPHSCMEGGADENNLHTETIELTSEVVIGMPGKPGLTKEEHDALVQATADANAAADRANGVIDDAEAAARLATAAAINADNKAAAAAEAARLADAARQQLTTTFNEKVAALEEDYAQKKAALDADYESVKQSLGTDYANTKIALEADYTQKKAALDSDYASAKSALSTAYAEAIASLNNRMSAIETQYATEKVEWQRQVDAILAKFEQDFATAEAAREERVARVVASANTASEGANAAADHATTEANAARKAAEEANAAASDAREAARIAMKPDMSNIDEAGKKKVNDVSMAGEVGQKIGELSSQVESINGIPSISISAGDRKTLRHYGVAEFTQGNYASTYYDPIDVSQYVGEYLNVKIDTTGTSSSRCFGFANNSPSNVGEHIDWVTRFDERSASSAPNHTLLLKVTGNYLLISATTGTLVGVEIFTEPKSGKITNIEKELSALSGDISDMIVHEDGTNCIDAANFKANTYINADGVEAAASGLMSSEKVYLKKDTDYYQFGLLNGYYALYDKDDNVLESFANGAGHIGSNPFRITTENFAYARFTSSMGTDATRIYISTNNALADGQNVSGTPSPSCEILRGVKTDGGTFCNYTGHDIKTFKKILCIGDSLTQGVFNVGEGGVVIGNRSYPSCLEQITGCKVTNLGIGGYTSTQWYERFKNLNLGGFDCCIIQLGVNDGLQASPKFSWTSESIMAFTNIISKVKAENSGIKIFVSTIIPAAAYQKYLFRNISQGIRDLVSSLNDNDVILEDIAEYGHTCDSLSYNNGHLNAYGYWRLAQDHSNLISYIMKTNKEDFTQLQFVELGENKTFGTWNEKPINTIANEIPIGYAYFCTDKSIDGGSQGIAIFHKGDNIWVDSLGRIVGE